jgi:hypothetical protein
MRSGSVKFAIMELACLAKIREPLHPDHHENWLAGDPSIHHAGVVTNCQKCFDGFLPGTHLWTITRQ